MSLINFMTSKRSLKYSCTSKGTQNPQNKYEYSTSFDSSKTKELRQPIAEKVSQANVAGSNNALLFKKGMKTNDLKINLFICEQESGFSERELNSKINYIAKQSDMKIKEWYYDLGVNNNLPNDWEEFKERLISFCSELGIEDIKKYADENWSSFLIRLQGMGKLKNINEETILRKLRTVKAPLEVQQVLFSFNVTLKDMIDRIEELETLKKNKLDVIRVHKKKETGKEKKFKCFKCGEFGHIKRNCPGNEKKVGLLSGKGNLSNIEEEEVQLNGLNYPSIFDSGSSVNIISWKVAESLKIKNRYELKEPIEISLLNKNKVHLKNYIIIDFKYKDYERKERFYLMKNPLVDVIVGNKLLKNISGNRFPIKCPVITQENKIISWNRPIFNKEKANGFQKLVDELLEKGYLEKSKSLWCHPVVVVKKKSGDFRFTLDLTKLNDIVDLDEFSIPKIGEITRSVHNAKYFSVLDLKDGFWQVELRNEDREKIAFLDTNNRLLQFKRMPQGFKNSPAVFQRGMFMILEGLVGKICLSYIDDIMVFGNTEEEHDSNLKTVIERLKAYGMAINEKKSVFRQKEISFLGYIIGFNFIKPAVARSQAIIDYQTPKNKREIRKFIGIVNYDRIFVPNLSELAKPLYLSIENRKHIWTDVEQDAFEKIKKIWETNLELTTPSDKERFTLETDASDIGIGAVLKQKNKPVAYISRLLKKAERNYTITEREALAALWAMEKFSNWLTGKEFDLITDHQALLKLKSKHLFGTKRITRWIERFNNFNFKTYYKQGNLLQTADALSRSIKEIDTQELREKVLGIHKNFMHRKSITKELREAGINITSELLQKILKECEICECYDAKRITKAGFIHTNSPGELVSGDILELERGKLIINIIDYFSRYLFSKVLVKKDSKEIIKLLERVNSKIGIKKLQLDNGREFRNKNIESWCKSRNIDLVFSIPYYHESNGRVERVNRTVREACKRNKGLLRKKLKNIVDKYNKSHHRAIGMKPEEALEEKNWKNVLENSLEYAKEFKKKKSKDSLTIGTSVLIRNENKKNKMSKEFSDEGKVVEKIGDHTYKVINGKGNKLIRHISQLKKTKN